MRKAILLLVLILLASPMVFAQAKKATPVTPAKVTVAPQNQGFVGVSLNQITVVPGVAPSARFGFGSWSLDVGGSLTNTNAGTSITIFGKGEIPISEIGKDVRTYWAPALYLYSPAGGGNSTTNLTLYLGAEYLFAPNLALFADLTAITLTSVGGTTTWTVGGNSFWIYSGGRLYF